MKNHKEFILNITLILWKKYYKINEKNNISPNGDSRIDNFYYFIILEICKKNSMENFIFGIKVGKKRRN